MADPRIFVVRNEVDADRTYHNDALVTAIGGAESVDYPAGDRVPLERADGVVLSGSSASVYETDRHPWIADQQALVRELVARGIPTLGVCFGHQLVNTALGGTVDHVGMTTALVDSSLEADPLFVEVDSTVVCLHGDVVTAPGDDLAVIASAPHASVFATRHRQAPLWTVQFHPEITAGHADRLESDVDWRTNGHSFAAVTTDRVLVNFERIVARRSAAESR